MKSICNKFGIIGKSVQKSCVLLISYLFRTCFILVAYFGLPKGPWHPEAGLGPMWGPPGPLARPASGRQGPFRSPKYDKSMK